MSHEVAVRGPLSNEQIELVKSQIAPRGTTNDELALFIAQCNRTGLDPFAKQIYLMERRERVNENGQWKWLTKRVPEVSIDGLRLVAERTGKYAGQTPPQWCGPDGKWRDVWLDDEPPAACRVGIYRAGFAEPLMRIATYKQAVQMTGGDNPRPNAIWTKMPAHMLAVRAESFGLRAAFPQELSGLYTPDEMGDEDEHHPTVTQPSGELRATDPDGRELVLGEAGSVEVVEPATEDYQDSAGDDTQHQDASGSEGGPEASGSGSAAAPAEEPQPDPSDFEPDTNDAGKPQHVHVLEAALEIAVLAGMNLWKPDTVLNRARKNWPEANLQSLDDLTEEQANKIMAGLEKAQQKQAA